MSVEVETIEVEAPVEATEVAEVPEVDIWTIPESRLGEALADEENLFQARNPLTGEVFSLPKLGFMPRKASKYLARAVEDKMAEADVIRGLVGMLAPDSFEDFDDLEDDQAVAVSQKWVKASGIELGESEALSEE